MKILFDYEIFVRQRFGGISKYYFELVNKLYHYNELRIDLYMGLNDSGYDFSALQDRITITGKTFRGTEKLHFLFNGLNKMSMKRFSATNRFDVIHKTYYSKAGLDFPFKKVITIHDMTHELFPQYFAKSDNTAALKKRCIDRSDGIICVSENTKNDLMNVYNIEDKRIKVIYHGISLTNVKEEKSARNKPYILYVGQRWGYKNFNLLLSAYNSSDSLKDNFNLVCFGGGIFNYSEKLFIRENNLLNNIIYLDGDDFVLAGLYKNAELFVYTSLYEGFGFPPLEAMQYGCPVLSSAVGSINEVVNESAVLFDPFSIEDLILKLNRMLEDSDLRKLMIERGYSRVKLFSWDRCASEHIEFYKEIYNS